MVDKSALRTAIEKAGGQGALAKQIGVPQSLVSYWLNKAKTGVAPERVLDVERVTGISRHDLRPDLYPRDTVAA